MTLSLEVFIDNGKPEIRVIFLLKKIQKEREREIF